MAKKGYDYFKAFAEMVDCAVEASALLEAEINEFHPDKVEDVRTRLHVIENSADRKKHELMDNLSREFVPPIEREDIAHLASEIDEVVDCIEDVEKENGTLSTEDVSAEYTVLTSTITPDTVLRTGETLLVLGDYKTLQKCFKL